MNNYNLKPLEKTAENVGASMARGVHDIFKGFVTVIKKHPLETVGAGVLGAGGLRLMLDWGNKVRGIHQIVNEAGKREVMDYQTRLLREIAESSRNRSYPATQQSSPTHGFKQQVPIVPPLR